MPYEEDKLQGIDEEKSRKNAKDPKKFRTGE